MTKVMLTSFKHVARANMCRDGTTDRSKVNRKKSSRENIELFCWFYNVLIENYRTEKNPLNVVTTWDWKKEHEMLNGRSELGKIRQPSDFQNDTSMLRLAFNKKKKRQIRKIKPKSFPFSWNSKDTGVMVCWLLHILVFTRRIQLFAALCVWKSAHALTESSRSSGKAPHLRLILIYVKLWLTGERARWTDRPQGCVTNLCMCVVGLCVSVRGHTCKSADTCPNFRVKVSLSLSDTHMHTLSSSLTPNPLIPLSQTVKQVLCIILQINRWQFSSLSQMLSSVKIHSLLKLHFPAVRRLNCETDGAYL